MFGPVLETVHGKDTEILHVNFIRSVNSNYSFYHITHWDYDVNWFGCVVWKLEILLSIITSVDVLVTTGILIVL